MRTPSIFALVSGFGFCVSVVSAQMPPSYQLNQTPPGNSAAAATPGQTSVQPQLPAIPPEQQKRIDEILGTWENDAKSLECLVAKFKVTSEDVVFNRKTLALGEAKVLKMPAGTYGIKLEIYEQGRDGKPDRTKLKQKYVFSGLWLYQYDPSNKIIHSQTVQQNMKPDDGPMAFIFGMKAPDARKRFGLSISQADQHWTWLKVSPLTPQDQKEFTIAQLGVVNYANAISPKEFPIRIMWREPNNNTQSWEFTEIVRNDKTKVSPLDFTIEEDKKAGWKVQLVPAPNSALQRNNQPNSIVPAGGFTPRK